MRKFFKSLAVLLALTLIVGVIPAAAADSLSMQKEKVLYLDGSKGQKEDGTQCKTSYKKLVANMIKGFDKDTMSVVLSSADKDIVKTTKAGRIVAKSLGTTTVTVTVKDASDEVQLKQDLKVIVKKNATDATFTVENIADGDKFTVGQTIVVKLPRKGVDTDQRSLVSSDDTIATVKEQADSKRVYDVTFVKAGEVTITAKAYQSSKYPAKTAEKVMKVTVANPAPQKVTQVADNAIEVEYASAIKDVITAASFKNDDIYYLIDQTKVPFSLINKVETDGNVAKLTFHSSFVANTTYYLNVADSDDLSFVAAGHELKDVDKIKLTLTKAYKETDNTITYVYYNAAGLDITNGVTKGYTENLPTFAITSDYSYQSTDKEGRAAIYFTEADKTATIKATLLLGYDEKTFAPIEKFDEIAITSTNAPTAVYTGETKYTITTNKAAHINKDSSVKSNFAIKDDAVLQILLQKKNPDGSLVWVNSKDYGISKVECGNENIAVVGAENVLGDGSHGGYIITGISEGTTNIILYTKNSAGKDEFFRAYPITVKAERYAANIDLNVTKTNLNIDSTVNDSAELFATVYDQYGEWLDKYAGTITVKQASGNNKSTGIAYGGNTIVCNAGSAVAQNWTIGGKPTNGSITIDYTDFSGFGGAIPVKTGKSIFFELAESTKSIKRNYSITVLSAAEADTNKWASSASNTALDTGLLTPELAGYNSNVKDSTLKIEKSYNGFYTGLESFRQIAKRANELSWAEVQALDGGSAASGSAIYLVYTELDGDHANKYAAAETGNTLSITDTNLPGSTTIKLININNNEQLVKGTYRFTFYKVERKAGAQTPTINIIGTHTVAVTNNQKMPTVTVKKDKVEYAGATPVLGDIIPSFQIDFGNDNKNLVPTDGDWVVAQNGDVYVKTLKVTLPTTVYGYPAGKQIDVTVNKLLTKK